MSLWQLVCAVKEFLNHYGTNHPAELCAIAVMDQWAKKAAGKVALEKQTYSLKLSEAEKQAFAWAFGDYTQNIWLFSTIHKLIG